MATLQDRLNTISTKARALNGEGVVQIEATLKDGNTKCTVTVDGSPSLAGNVDDALASAEWQLDEAGKQALVRLETQLNSLKLLWSK